MKAIAIIDLPDFAETDGVIAEAMAIYKNKVTGKWNSLKIRPLPIRRGKITLTERSQDTDMLVFQLKTNMFSEGWNACIDKIVGEEEQ